MRGKRASATLQSSSNYIGLSTTTLNAAATSTATSLTGTTTGFPGTGMLKVDNEVITYGAVSGTAFNSVTRRAARTTAAAHSAGAAMDGRLAQIHVAGTCKLAAGAAGTCDSSRH